MLRVGRGGRRALSARVRDLPYPVDELPDEELASLSDPFASPWRRRRRAWRWWLAATLPVLAFLAGWMVAKPDAQAPRPEQAAAAVHSGPGAATPSNGTPALSPEEAQRLGKEAAEQWLEDWAAIVRLLGGDVGVAGGDPPPDNGGLASAPPVQQAAPGAFGIPAMMLQAYEAAAQWARGYAPDCRLHWAFVAGVGRVESDHGRHGGAGFTATGQVQPPIVGVALDGSPGVKRIPDTDGGRWDGDTTWDRAVGPMQFLPMSWQELGRDGNGDGAADPHNAFDAAVSAAAFLCRSAGGSLSDRATLERALHAYNHSTTYVQTVLTWADAYGIAGARPLPNPVPR